MHAQATVVDFKKQIRGMEEVLDCHLLTGGTDYLLRVAVADLEDYERFIRRRMHRIDGIAALDTSFACGLVKSGTQSYAKAKQCQ